MKHRLSDHYSVFQNVFRAIANILRRVRRARPLLVLCIAALAVGVVCLNLGTLTQARGNLGSGGGFFTWWPARGVGAPSAEGTGGTYTVFEAACGGTGAVQGTIPLAINASGTIAGLCIDANMAYHGFVRAAGGAITLINDPNAGTGATQGTAPISINASGEIAGIYFDKNTAYHGFLYAGGKFTEIDVPGAGTSKYRGTSATSIDTAGDVAGTYTTGVYQGNSAYHGFVRSAAGTIKTFDAPGAGTGYEQGTRGVGSDGAGNITGLYQDANNVDHGFVRSASDGTIRTFDAPGAATSGCKSKPFKPTQATSAISIDTAGDIAGIYTDKNCLHHGFIRSGATGNAITSFDAPGVGSTPGMFQGTGGFSVNDSATIVGGYSDAKGVLHGFVRTKDGTMIAPLDAPGAGTGAGPGIVEGTSALSINDSGGIAGTYSDVNGVFHGFLLVPAPEVGLSPTSLNFGNQVINATSSAKTVTVTNTGTATLDISGVTIDGDFAISAKTCGATVNAGKKCEVSVTFTPKGLGALKGMLSVSDNASGSPQTVALSGTGVEPATLTPASATYGKQKVGTTSAASTFTLTNNQTETLTSIALSTTGDFAVSATTCTTSLAAKGKCTISVTLKPTATGTRTGKLTVKDNANNSPQTSNLTGTGT